MRDMMDQDTTLVGERKCGELREMVESPDAPEARLQDKLVAQHYYSSPNYSYSSSPVTALVESLTDDSEEEEEVSPPILAGQKRRLSCSEPAHDTVSTLTRKRRKQLCPDFSSLVEVSSREDASETHGHNQPPHSIWNPHSFTGISASRKRRLSDADAAGVPKHLQGSVARPRPHAVSDPLPLSTLESDRAIDEWFSSNFDALFALPPPADVFEPDLTAQWEVELFNNYNIPAEPQKRPFKSLNPPTCDQASTPVDLFALDDFLRPLESGGYVPPPEIMDPAITFSAADSVPQDPLLSSESIDWASLFNLQTSEPSLDSIFVQSNTSSLPLPEIDLSIIQLP